MFTKKRIVIDGKFKDLAWIANDNQCFDYIKADWDQFAGLYMSHVKERGAVIQAGGNCGLYPLLYANLFERVFTFEPDPMNFYCLAQNCTNSKIIKFNTALGHVPGYLAIGNPNPSNVGMTQISEGGTIIYSMTIDSLNVPKVGLIHLDVEGFEYKVLWGAIDTIKSNKPVIVVEMMNDHDEIMKFLDENGYKPVAFYGTPVNRVFVPKEWK